MIFGERMKLTEEYFKWITLHNIADTPLSVITFLDLHGYLKKNKKVKKVLFTEVENADSD